MDIGINEVKDLIESLESNDELSIKEEKYLKVAKLCVQLAAENVALKLAIPEQRNVEFDNDSMDDVSLAEDVGFNDAIGQMKINISKTPATDRIVAGIKADGVEQYAALFADTVNMEREHNQQFHKGTLWFAKQLREEWRQMSKSFIVIIRRAWCNEGGHGIEYSSDLIHYETRNGAISHGFRTVDSDDFNIGVIEEGGLVSFDWMDKPVGESEDTLAQIAELIGLEAQHE